jgi:hypothetical protein
MFHFLTPRLIAFAVDRGISECYKTRKDELFGGESPNELQNAMRE